MYISLTFQIVILNSFNSIVTHDLVKCVNVSLILQVIIIMDSRTFFK